ncbi:MAG: hypothetical protein ABJQ21_24245 [Roseibium sp.]
MRTALLIEVMICGSSPLKLPAVFIFVDKGIDCLSRSRSFKPAFNRPVSDLLHILVEILPVANFCSLENKVMKQRRGEVVP